MLFRSRFDKKGDRLAPSYFCKLLAKGTRIKSTAHALFLKQFGAPISFKKKFDGFKELSLVDYNTANRIEPEKEAKK